MKKKLVNHLFCLAHITYVILLEALLAVSIIWFSDYKYSLNPNLVLCLCTVLGLHYSILVFKWKDRTLTRNTLNVLLCIDCLACVASCFAWITSCIFFVTMPYLQVAFTIAINALVLLLRIIVTIYIRFKIQH